MRSVLIQLRLGARALRRAPVASAFIVVTLALCIGASAGVFSVVYGVLFRGLPYWDPGRLMWIASVRPNRADASFSLPEFMDLRERVRAVDPEAATSGLSNMSSYVDGVLAPRRFAVALLLGVSAIALALAAVGVYGVMAYSVTQRRREISVRLALGAPPRRVIGLILWQALGLSALGIALGVAGSLLAGRAVAGLLFGIAPNDAQMLVEVSVVMGAVSLAASWIPARRAARVDPVLVLSAG
jgi:hypothetical protein